MKKSLLRFLPKLRSSEQHPELIRSLFSKFQIILDMNTKLLEKMALMERALGGEYIFDKAFLESSEIGRAHV
jgi:pyruvate, water dikinase